MSSSSQSQSTSTSDNLSESKQFASQPQLPSPHPLPSSRRNSASLLLPVSATMPNAVHEYSSGNTHRFSNFPDWTSQPQTHRYPFPVNTQQFLPPSYSGQPMLPPSFSGQSMFPPHFSGQSEQANRDQTLSYVDKHSSADPFASSSFDPVSRSASAFPQNFQPNQLELAQQQLLAQMISAQQQQQQPQFNSPRFSQYPVSAPTPQPTLQPLRSPQAYSNEPMSFEQLRRLNTPASTDFDSTYTREQDPYSISSQLGLSSNFASTTIHSLNTPMPSDPRASTITSSSHTVSYTNLPAIPTAHGVMASQDLASIALMFGARPNPAHEWLIDNSAPPSIAVNQGAPFITSLDTKVPLPPSPASASLASPATANTSISSVSLDGYELASGPVAVRTASGASGTPLSSPSSSSPTVSPQLGTGVAGGKRGREESSQSLSHSSDPEFDTRQLSIPPNSLSFNSSLASRSNPVSPSVSTSSVTRIPTPSSALTHSFTTISLSSVPSTEASDPSSYLFQRPSPCAGPSASSSTGSLPECVSASSLIFQPKRSSSIGASSQSLLLDDPSIDGSVSPSKKIKSGPLLSPSAILLPSSSSYTSSGTPSLTWPAQSPASRHFPSQSTPGASAYPFNAVPTNRPSKKPGKAEPKGPKNPRSAYVYFVADQRKKLARTEMLANSTFQEVASALGARWRTLSQEERRPFEEMARRDKERYQTEKSRSYDD